MILCFSGHDPTGGAGLQADIETLSALGAHALSVITALTVQDSRNVARVIATDSSLLDEQLDRLLADCRPQAIKLGLIANAAQLPVIISAIRRCAVPAICDPILRAGGGADLVDEDYATTLRRELLPWITVLTPNRAEARRLVPEAESLDQCGSALLAAGCAEVLITGGDESGISVINTRYRKDAAPQSFAWPRLPETFHGAGCTLASAIAARIAHGDGMDRALANAQTWTQASLERAFAVGQGRRIPGRRQA